MIKYFRSTLSPILMLLVLTTPQMSQAMEQTGYSFISNMWDDFLSIIGMGSVPFPLSDLPQEIHEPILKKATYDTCYEFGHADNIGLVCKAWKNFINQKRYTSPLHPNLTVDLQRKCIEEIFFNGQLVFRPNPYKTIKLNISDLANPLEGTFDLSSCEDMGNKLSISTGYKKEKIKKNKGKLEIWFATREFIKQELREGRAQEFKDIFLSWEPKAPVGIFWTWGSYDVFHHTDHLTSSDLLTLSSEEDLYEKWLHRRGEWFVMGIYIDMLEQSYYSICDKFYVYFKENYKSSAFDPA